MSRQVNYYMSSNDSARLLEGIDRNFSNIIYIPRRSTLIASCKSQDVLNQTYGVGYLITIDKYKSQIDVKYNEKIRFFIADPYKFPAIEFTVCFFDNINIRAGRIYVDTYTIKYAYTNNEIDFLHFVNKIFKFFKNNLIINGSYYYGGEALDLLTSGKSIFH